METEVVRMTIRTPKKRREGDTRPFKTKGRLKLFPMTGEKIRWLPRQGEPVCIVEVISQVVAKIVSYSPVYTAVIVTLSLFVQLYFHYGR